MKFNIEKITVVARSRRLSAEYTLETQQPLRWINRREVLKDIEDILKENEPMTTKMSTEDGTVLWEKK
jgi:hypothetical protein